MRQEAQPRIASPPLLGAPIWFQIFSTIADCVACTFYASALQ